MRIPKVQVMRRSTTLELEKRDLILKVHNLRLASLFVIFGHHRRHCRTLCPGQRRSEFVVVALCLVVLLPQCGDISPESIQSSQKTHSGNVYDMLFRQGLSRMSANQHGIMYSLVAPARIRSSRSPIVL